MRHGNKKRVTLRPEAYEKNTNSINGTFEKKKKKRENTDIEDRREETALRKRSSHRVGFSVWNLASPSSTRHLLIHLPRLWAMLDTWLHFTHNHLCSTRVHTLPSVSSLLLSCSFFSSGSSRGSSDMERQTVRQGVCIISVFGSEESGLNTTPPAIKNAERCRPVGSCNRNSGFIIFSSD